MSAPWRVRLPPQTLRVYGGSDGLFGAPVGGVDRRVPQEGERGGEFAVQMGGEAVGGVTSVGAFVRSADRVGRTVDRERLPDSWSLRSPASSAVAQLESGLQDGLHPGGPRAARMHRFGVAALAGSSEPDTTGAARG